MSEPVPEEVRRAARRAFAERDVDAQILELVYDSLLDDLAQPVTHRRLAFGASDGASLSVAVEQRGEGVALRIDLTIAAAQLGGDVAEVCVGQVTERPQAGPSAELDFPHHGLLCSTVTASGRRWKTSSVRV